jgi:hypothetical protein
MSNPSSTSLLLLLLLVPVGIINAQLLSWLRPGSAVINGGRGKQLLEADLLEALDRGQVRTACALVSAAVRMCSYRTERQLKYLCTLLSKSEYV